MATRSDPQIGSEQLDSRLAGQPLANHCNNRLLHVQQNTTGLCALGLTTAVACTLRCDANTDVTINTIKKKTPQNEVFS
jgi:hypothetical protein